MRIDGGVLVAVFFVWCYKLVYMGLLNIKIDCVLFFFLFVLFSFEHLEGCALKLEIVAKKKEEHIKPKFDARTFRR